MTRNDIRKRLSELELNAPSWIDYVQLDDDAYYYGEAMDDYADGTWEEVHHDPTRRVTVLRNTETGVIRGIHDDKRSEQQMIAEGGDLAYL